MEPQDLAQRAVTRYCRRHDVSRCKAQEDAHSAFLLEARAHEHQGEGRPCDTFGIAYVLLQLHWITSSLVSSIPLLKYSMRRPRERYGQESETDG